MLASNDNMLANSVDRQIGANLRAARERIGLGLAEAARRVNICTAELAAYESGRTRLQPGRMFALSMALRIPLHAFFGKTSPPLTPISLSSQQRSELGPRPR